MQLQSAACVSSLSPTYTIILYLPPWILHNLAVFIGFAGIVVFFFNIASQLFLSLCREQAFGAPGKTKWQILSWLCQLKQTYHLALVPNTEVVSRQTVGEKKTTTGDCSLYYSWVCKGRKLWQYGQPASFVFHLLYFVLNRTKKGAPCAPFFQCHLQFNNPCLLASSRPTHVLIFSLSRRRHPSLWDSEALFSPPTPT